MRKLGVMMMLAALVMLVPRVTAQEKAKAPQTTKPVTPLKVQVVFSEYDGEKKLSSLPYAVFVNADDRENTHLRMGVRVPVATGGFQAVSATGPTNAVNPLVNTQFQYVDVGSNIDCSAQTAEEGQFRLQLTLERSSIYSYTPSAEEKGADRKAEEVRVSNNPVLRQFRVSLSLLMRDGQTVQSTMATDPQSGRVLKVDVTVNVVKRGAS